MFSAIVFMIFMRYTLRVNHPYDILDDLFRVSTKEHHQTRYT